MTAYKVVVDGSNIATEGRSLPSLSQLDEAVRAFIDEHPLADVLVIVDSTFAHRISTSEQPIFEAAYAAGEIICPPAGTIGRGDSFILKVADKMGATILSNDSFQEFHGTYDWLFSKGRLVGGKPVPGLGWVFMDRTPVRGPKSREAVRESKRTKVRIGSPEASLPMPVPKTPPPFTLVRGGADATDAALALALAEPDAADHTKKSKRGKARDKSASDKAGKQPHKAERSPLEPVAADKGDRKRRKRRRGATTADAPIEPINDPVAFISFIAAHAIGSQVTGLVDAYSSHGFYVLAAGARCYVPLHGLAVPIPRSAKELVRRGEDYTWIVKSFDPPRRGIELALPGSPSAFELGDASADGQAAIGAVAPSDAPKETDEPVRPARRRGAAASAEAPSDAEVPAAAAPARARRTRTRTSVLTEVAASVAAEEEPTVTPAKVAEPAATAAKGAVVDGVPRRSRRLVPATTEVGAPTRSGRARKATAPAIVVAEPAAPIDSPPARPTRRVRVVEVPVERPHAPPRARKAAAPDVTPEPAAPKRAKAATAKSEPAAAKPAKAATAKKRAPAPAPATPAVEASPGRPVRAPRVAAAMTASAAPASTAPAAALPAKAKPAKAKPSKAAPAKAVEAAPSEAAPADAVKAARSEAAPVKAARATPARATPSKATPGKVTKAGPAKAPAAPANAVKAVAVKAAPAKAAPADAVKARADAVKAGANAVKAPAKAAKATAALD